MLRSSAILKIFNPNVFFSSNDVCIRKIISAGGRVIRNGATSWWPMLRSFQSLLLQRRASAGSSETYVFATLCVVIASLLRWALGWVPDPISAFPTYYPAVFFAALIGGAGPGAFAAIAGGFVGWWAFIPERYELFLLKSGQEFNLAAYLFASLLIVWGADRLRVLTKQVEGEERLRKLAVEELAHRLKNKLATLQSIVSYQLREHPRIRDDILGRLYALSLTDGLIMAAQGRGARLHDVLSAELGPYDAPRVFIEGPDTFLSSTIALTLALLFHELATNAAKYGALSSPAGHLSVNWVVSKAQLSFKWHESGGPAVSAPNHRGFGTRLLSGALDHFDGKLHMAFEPTGVICTICLRLAEDVPTLVPKTDRLKAFPLR